MSFRLRIDSAENLGGETRIRGRVIEGAYFGPQYIRLKDTTGKERTTTILSHGLIGSDLGWPVTADHDTQLELYIATPAAPFAVDANSPLQGLGNVALRQDSTDLSGALSNPLFLGQLLHSLHGIGHDRATL